MINKKKSGLTNALIALVAAVFALAAGAATAQDDGGLIQVAEVRVKMDQVQKFTELQQAMSKAGREAGRTGRNVWQVTHGPTNTFHIVEPRANFAAFDDGGNFAMSGDELSNWIASIVQTIDTRTIWVLRSYPDLAIPAAEDDEQNLVRIRIRTVKPGMNAAYEAWVRDDLMPELKEGGETGVGWFRGVTGMSPNTWFSVTRHDSYAEMDPPGPLQHLGAEGASELLRKAAGMQTGDNQDLVLRYRDDMSW